MPYGLCYRGGGCNMYIPQDELEYVRFMLIVDGLFAGAGAAVLVSYIVLCIIEWIRRLKK